MRRFKEGMMAVPRLPSAVLGARKWAVLGDPEGRDRIWGSIPGGLSMVEAPMWAE